MIAAATISLFVLAAGSGGGAPAYEAILPLPHPLRSGESAWLEVQVGPTGRGQEIDITTKSGQQLGTISPYGIRAGQAAGTYTVPLPSDAVHNGRVSVRLTISQYGNPPRAPTAQEVQSVKLILTPRRD